MFATYLRRLYVIGLTASLAAFGTGCPTSGGGGGGGAQAMDDGQGTDDGTGADDGAGDDGAGDTSIGAPVLFTAELNGVNQRPDPVQTNTTGQARIVTNEGLVEWSYAIDVQDGINVNAAHIHEGGPEDTGGIIVSLFSGAETQVNGELVQGTITAGDLIGTLQGGTLQDLIELIEAGNAYVNVHTDQNPGGEIRGQLTLDG